MDLNIDKISNSLNKASILIKKKEEEQMRNKNIIETKTDYLKLIIYFGIIITIILMFIVIIIYIYNLFNSTVIISQPNNPIIVSDQSSISNIIKQPSSSITTNIKQPLSSINTNIKQSAIDTNKIETTNNKSFFDFIWGKKTNDTEVVKDIDKYINEHK